MFCSPYEIIFNDLLRNDLPKAFASASRLRGLFICSLLRANSHRYQMKKISSYR
jgi:hypothetical protein